jgi:regulator of sigma E protease
MLNILYGIIALSLLILVHELGHFLIAKIANVKILTFSLGFGKKLLSYKKGETEYAVSLVPLGGYVKLLGESPDDEVKEEEIHRSYANKPPLVKIIIAFTGPLFNILFAFVLFYLVFLSGYSVLSTKVGGVEKGYPAYEAGIKEGDIITRIEGKGIEEWGDLMEAMADAPYRPLKFTVKRGNTSIDVTVMPKEIESKNIFGETIKRKVIGVIASNEFFTKKETLAGATSKAFYQTYNLSRITIVGIVKLIEGSISPKNIGGPLLILEMAGKQAKEGKKNLIYFIALISINLGIINLFPIPILDGGHILFHVIEIVTRRKMSEKWVDISQKIGMGFLVALMVLAFFNDIMRMFYGK